MRLRLTWLCLAIFALGCSQGHVPGDGARDSRADTGLQDVGPDADVGGEFDSSTGDALVSDGAGDSGGGGDGEADADKGDDVVDAEPNGCTPDRNGVVERDEVIMEPGLYATFQIAEDVEVDSRGVENDDGERLWDLSEELPGDEIERVDLKDPSGTWFESEFPEAAYYSELSASDDELGIFGVDGEGLYLQGVVSPEDGTFRTELEYDPPAQILGFPMELGATWHTDSRVRGVYNGGGFAGNEEYDSRVDAEGILKTPFGEFDVLRVRTDLERRVGYSTTTQVIYSFVAECFGIVATLRLDTREDGEGEATVVEEVRRLSR